MTLIKNIMAVTGTLLLIGTGLTARADNGNNQCDRDNDFKSVVLRPEAQPYGWSLRDMAEAVADFSISGNDPAYYPNTPFEILYHNPATTNTFIAKPDTFSYVKVVFFDDSPPVLGDWPANKRQAVNYIFGRHELGGHNLQITVDGKAFSLDDPGYIGGPVPTPNSPDGSSHFIQIGAFITPLHKGTHTIIFSGVFDGDAVIAAFGGPYANTTTYTVIVK